MWPVGIFKTVLKTCLTPTIRYVSDIGLYLRHVCLCVSFYAKEALFLLSHTIVGRKAHALKVTTVLLPFKAIFYH